MSALLDVLSAQERVVSELSKEIVRLRTENVRLIRELRIVRGMLAEGRTTGHSIRASAQEAEDYIGLLLEQDGDA